ncbi:hypothetical protein PLICRDRAFT_56526 [Plicaturopsis crispa FD-325 SS-3]|nr:hypothetical protein PLICRDRAFT_56526 [Plicaturopsis crispa FD-325 SS-3]
MSSRLKRKLGDIGVDTHSAKANESFCLIGTPLPPLEKSKDTGEFVPLWKQEVRDEKGRRRLHGAFTGGFSAGHFNTVGSKEGWTPTEFVSSRSQRGKQKAARPEDFMDEEDLADLKDSQKLVDETEEMDILGGTQAEVRRRGGDDPEQDSVAVALESSMLPAPKDSVGARILKKMGWRLGQGIGPRMTWRQRRKQDLQASTGNALDLAPEDDEEANKHTYAPRDTAVLLVDRKDNSHGLGYRPGMGLHESVGTKGPAGPRLAAGFGLGALNDADDDDVDIYDGGAVSRNRMAYDAADRDDDERIVIGRGAQVQQQPRSTSASQTFHDGRPVLSGFILSEKPVAEDRWFPLPDVPKGWKPDPQRVWAKDKENVARKAAQEPQGHAAWKAGKSADERGTILGEIPLPAAPRSVFEYMSQKDRERLKNIIPGSAPGKPPPPPEAAPTVPRTESHIAQAALRGFQPFTTDPAKQARYTAYLHSQATPSDPDDTAPPLPPLPGQTVDELNRELSDYAKAALLFKPMSGAMAGRFTSAAIIDNGPKIIEGLHTPSAADAKAEEAHAASELERFKAEESPKAHAARMGMYGPMTREVRTWQPNKLLCKRFGVKDPHPEPMAEPAAPASTSGWEPPSVPEPPIAADASFRAAPGKKGHGRRDLDNVGLGEDEEQGRDTLTYERPAMDIFKAIFASDDEDSADEDDAAEVRTDAVTVPPQASAAPGPSTSVETQPSSSNILPVAPVPAADEKVDLATFKPTFVPRGDRSTKKDKDKKEKKDKKKKGKVLVSFEMDEDQGEEPVRSKDKDRERPKKKMRKEKDGGDDDDGMWVEKPPPEVVKNISAPPLHLHGDPAMDSGPPTKGRKRAIDFM